MSVNSKMTAIADAIRGKTGGTDPLTLDQMATEIAGIEAGGGASDAVELVYETEFSVTEKPTENGNLCTVSTGLDETKLEAGDVLWCVIECFNDTDTDDSYNHFVSRTQNIIIHKIDGRAATSPASGGMWSVNNAYGAMGSYSVGIVDVTNWAATFNIRTQPAYAGYGVPAPGDYSLKVYRMKHSYFGPNGVVL